MLLGRHTFRVLILLSGLAPLALMSTISGCGASSDHAPPPIVLSVSLNSPVTLPQGGTIYVPVNIDAPTETATFSMIGLPNGVSWNYKESESNPSGQLTLIANAQATLGTYMPKITVGSSGQTASVVFTLIVSAPAKTEILSEPSPVEPGNNP